MRVDSHHTQTKPEGQSLKDSSGLKPLTPESTMYNRLLYFCLFKTSLFPIVGVNIRQKVDNAAIFDDRDLV